MKRSIVAMFAAGALLLSGCSGVDASAYDAVKCAAEKTVQQQSGVMQITNQAAESEDMNLCFTYCYADDGVMQYCLEQTDRSGRRVFLEHHDGTVMQRWLLGHGSTVYDETDGEFVRYTREMPYKYLSLLIDIPEKKDITELTVQQTDTGTEYLLTLDPAKVKGETDAKETLAHRTLQYTVSADGTVSCYRENSSYLCADGTENHYTLTVMISQLGAVPEVSLPKIE